MARADKVVLPGVGAFGDAMAELKRRELVEPIRQAVASGKPFLGICLGLQLLFDVGYENGTPRGLGILPGEVVRFELPHEYKVPHMGWNQLAIRRPAPLLGRIWTTACTATSCTPITSCRATARSIATETSYPDAVLLDDLARQPVRHPVPSRKEPADGLRMLKNFAEL